MSIIDNKTKNTVIAEMIKVMISLLLYQLNSTLLKEARIT